MVEEDIINSISIDDEVVKNLLAKAGLKFNEKEGTFESMDETVVDNAGGSYAVPGNLSSSFPSTVVDNAGGSYAVPKEPLSSNFRSTVVDNPEGSYAVPPAMVPLIFVHK